METITIEIKRDEVYEEVAKATDYTGSKLIDGDDKARDRILAADEDLAELGRFWDESALAVNENFKEMLIQGVSSTFTETIVPTPADPIAPQASPPATPITNRHKAYRAEFEVSKSFDKALTASVESTLRSYFIASIIGMWFKFANKGEASDYFAQAAELLETAERLLYSRKKPTKPTD